MLTAILRSRTLGAMAIAYLLAVLMLAFVFWSRPQGGSVSELLALHWAFSWTEKVPVAIPIISLIAVSGLAMLSRLKSQSFRHVSGNSNLIMIAILSLILGQGGDVFSMPDTLLSAAISVGMFLLLFSTHKRESVLSEIFHVGALLGLASLFYGPALLFGLAVGSTLLVLRSGNWKEWVVLVLGMAMVAVFVLMVTIWYESPILSFQRVVTGGWMGFSYPNTFHMGHVLMLPSLAVATIGLLASLTHGNVAERNLAIAYAGWIVTALLMVLFLNIGVQSGVVLAAYPIGIFIAKQIELIKRGWLADILLLLLIAAPFVSNLWQL
jgi:hypothetical protein